jgi:hypothetical protein
VVKLAMSGPVVRARAGGRLVASAELAATPGRANRTVRLVVRQRTADGRLLSVHRSQRVPLTQRFRRVRTRVTARAAGAYCDLSIEERGGPQGTGFLADDVTLKAY